MAAVPNLSELLAIIVGLRDHAQSLGPKGERLTQRIDVEITRAGLTAEDWADIRSSAGTWRGMIWAGVEH